MEPKFLQAALDEDGMILEDLEEKLKNHDNAVHLRYQTSKTPPAKPGLWKEEKVFIELANKYDVMILKTTLRRITFRRRNSTSPFAA